MEKELYLDDKSKKDIFFVNDESTVESIVCQGILLKKNKFFRKQPRLFTLFSEGVIKYHKNMTAYKGNIILDKSTRVLKTAKNQIEIPTLKKTYILIAADLKKYAEPAGKAGQAPKEYRNPSLDEW